MTETFIRGKDAALETTLERLHQALVDLGYHIEEARWLNPAPHIWSVHIRDRDCPQVFSNGKGTTREAALASAYGEVLERLSTRYLWADFYLTPVLEEFGHVQQPEERWYPADGAWPEELLDTATRRRYLLDGELSLAELADLNGGDSGRGVCALPYVRQRDGRTVYFPVNLIGNLFVSNGMSAGNTRAEAQVQGLSEIFERAVKERIISEAISLPEVPAEVLARYPDIVEGMAALSEHGFHLRALDASLGGRYPVTCIVLQHPEDGGAYACFGAHPCFEVALERTLTELVQGRALDELAGFPPPTADQELVSDPHNLELHFIDASGHVSWALLSDSPDIPFADWDDSRSNEAQRDALIDLLHAQGHDVYIAEHTALGAYACRILVPGFSDIYPADELKWHNNNQALPVRHILFGLKDAGEDGWRRLLEVLDTENVNDQMAALEWAGIAPDADTRWERLRLGELKMWLLLALGEQGAAFDQLEMVRASGDMSDTEQSELAALHAVLELILAGVDLDDYRRALVAFHGVENVAWAEACVRRELHFPGLGVMDPACPTQAHGALLEGYRKVLRGQARAAS
ncbi:MAG TPA: 30S ribosomal protein S12 methylthiotransferase accessory factor YcaO [Halomonas sp.]|nr:30S ribosomal protein S12 methylthiotransferase accessory factor YcaO [Halomonas sp.]